MSKLDSKGQVACVPSHLCLWQHNQHLFVMNFLFSFLWVLLVFGLSDDLLAVFIFRYIPVADLFDVVLTIEALYCHDVIKTHFCHFQ